MKFDLLPDADKYQNRSLHYSFSYQEAACLREFVFPQLCIAGEIHHVRNWPGSFVLADIWAESQPLFTGNNCALALIPATRGPDGLTTVQARFLIKGIGAIMISQRPRSTWRDAVGYEWEMTVKRPLRHRALWNVIDTFSSSLGLTPHYSARYALNLPQSLAA